MKMLLFIGDILDELEIHAEVIGARNVSSFGVGAI
jgi:hypothetical protein